MHGKEYMHHLQVHVAMLVYLGQDGAHRAVSFFVCRQPALADS